MGYVDGERRVPTQRSYDDWISIAAAPALAGSWIWFISKKHFYPGFRSKASLAAFVCVSIAVALLLFQLGFLQWLGLGGLVRNVDRLRTPYVMDLAAVGILSSAALLLALLGKGSPRLLALLWIGFLAFENGFLYSEFYRLWREHAAIEKRLSILSGKGAIHCGQVRSWTDPQRTSECVVASFGSDRPFFALYDTHGIGIDTHEMDGLAGDRVGNLCSVEFSSVGWQTEGLPGGTQLVDGGHILVKPCLKPKTLRKSIYNGLTCLPRMMESPGNTN